MQVNGDMFEQVYGNKYETHYGNFYKFHKGETIIQEIGNTISNISGNTTRNYNGNIDDVIQDNVKTTIYGLYNQTVGMDVTKTFSKNYNIEIGGSKIQTIFKNYKCDIKENFNVTISGEYTVNCENKIDFYGKSTFNLQAVDNINISTTQGNIQLKTEGMFQLMKNGQVTPVGYNNIGNKGNIRITSTFGNIGITTVQNEAFADFKRAYVCVPWNPSYLKYMSFITAFFNLDIPSLVLKDISGPASSLVTWLLSMSTIDILFDGFPSFLPCRMIMQNPNIQPPDKTSKQWIKDFRSIDVNWNGNLNKTYWKLISKLMGNIDISSWCGDISVVTKGTLGNAGNINIFANNEHGGLPGYQCGNVNIAADTPFRIFTDPRDLFFDSSLPKKILGKYTLFSSQKSTGNILSDLTVQSTVKPFQAIQMLLNLLGLPGQFGFTSMDSGGGGCIKCIVDVLHSQINNIQGFSLLPFQIIKPFMPSNTNPVHTFNSLYNSHIDPVEGDSSNLLKKFSNGFGHTVDNFQCGHAYQNMNYKLGGVYINATGACRHHVGKSYKVYANETKFQFGIERSVKVGWVEPRIDMTPPVPDTGIKLPVINFKPIVQKYTTLYSNKLNQKDLGTYKQVFNGLPKTIMYPLIAVIPNAGLGYTNTQLSLNIPLIRNSKIMDINLNLGLPSIQSMPYQIPWSYYSNMPSAELVTITNKWTDSFYSDSSTSIAASANEDAENNPLNTLLYQYTNLNDPLIRSIMYGGKVNKIDFVNGKALSLLSYTQKGQSALDKAKSLRVSDMTGQFFNLDAIFKKDEKPSNSAGFSLQLGDPDFGWGLRLFYQHKMKQFKQDMPMFSMVASTIASVASPIIKTLIPGIGQFVVNALKGLPDMYLPGIDEFEGTLTPVGTISGRIQRAAGIVVSGLVSGGIININPGLPLLNAKFTFGLPNIAKFLDTLFADGIMLLFNPVMIIPTILQVLGTSGKVNELINQLQCNLKIGIGALGPLGQMTDCKDIAYIQTGLKPHVTPFLKACIFEQLGVLDAYFGACLQPPKLSIKDAILSLNPVSFIQPSPNAPAITGNAHILGTGIRSQLKATANQTSVDIKLDVLNDLLESNVGAANIEFGIKGPGGGLPQSIGNFSLKFKASLLQAFGGIFPLIVELGNNKGKVTIFGLQIFKYPGILGKALIDAIKNIFGL